MRERTELIIGCVLEGRESPPIGGLPLNSGGKGKGGFAPQKFNAGCQEVSGCGVVAWVSVISEIACYHSGSEGCLTARESPPS